MSGAFIENISQRTWR